MIVHLMIPGDDIRTTGNWRVAVDWFRCHVPAHVSHVQRIVRQLLVRGRAEEVMLRMTHDHRPHLTAVADDVIVTRYIDDPSSLEGWRADGTVLAGRPARIIIPFEPDWAVGKAGSASHGVGFNHGAWFTIRAMSFGARDVPLGHGVSFGWRSIHDHDAFPERTMAHRRESLFHVVARDGS